MSKASPIDHSAFGARAAASLVDDAGIDAPGEAVGSARSARHLVEQHEAALTRYATRIVGDPERARDIVQDVFVRLLSRGDATLEGRLPQWLYTVCRNRALDVVRKEGRRERLAHRIAPSAPSPTPDAEVERRELLERTRGAIERLPDKQAQVLRLKLEGAKSYAEIAEATGLTASYVGYLLHHALRALRDELSEARHA